jgi:hypothetical protein
VLRFANDFVGEPVEWGDYGDENGDEADKKFSRIFFA